MVEEGEATFQNIVKDFFPAVLDINAGNYSNFVDFYKACLLIYVYYALKQNA